MRASLSSRLLHRRVESGEGDDLINALESLKRQKLRKNRRRKKRCDAGNGVEIFHVVSLAPLLHDLFLQLLASLHEERGNGGAGYVTILLEIPLMDHEIGRRHPQFPEVPHERFLFRHLLRLDEAVSILLRREEREVLCVHVVGLSLAYGETGNLLGVQRIGDFHEVPSVSKRASRHPMVRSGALKKDGIVSADVVFLEMDNELFESDTGVGKGSWHRRFSISIPDACDQLLLSHVNANRLIHGVCG